MHYIIHNGVSFWIFSENYHSLGNKYCGKRYKYTHASMLVRSALTAIDHNNNVLRQQVTIRHHISIFLNLLKARREDGVLRFSLVKQRNATKYTVKKVKAEKDYSWREAIASLVLKVEYCLSFIMYFICNSSQFEMEPLPKLSCLLGRDCQMSGQ